MERETLAMIADGLERILVDAPLDVIDAAGGIGGEADALWGTLAENGYPMLCAVEEHGGVGAALSDAVVIASLAARHAVSLPLADTMLSTWIISQCGVEPPPLRIAIADPKAGAAPLAHAAQAQAVLRIEDRCVRVSRIDSGDVELTPKGEDGAGYLRNQPVESVIDTRAPDWLSEDKVHALGAMIRAANMAGAMQAVLDLTLHYTREREQFGRPLAKFQAIQHHLSDIACETAASIAAVELASDALAADPHCGADVIDEIAIAKIRCGEAASVVATAAHQAHGAMGFTREYALGRFTRRLWQWQDEFGHETQWAKRLGAGVLNASDPSLWPRISQPI